MQSHQLSRYMKIIFWAGLCSANAYVFRSGIHSLYRDGCYNYTKSHRKYFGDASDMNMM